MEGFNDLVSELEDVQADQREKLFRSIPDLIAETPRTDAAIMRVKKVLAKVAPETAKVILRKLEDIAIAAVLAKLGFSVPS